MSNGRSGRGNWTDDFGRAELFVHPDIVSGATDWRFVDDAGTEAEEPPVLGPLEPVVGVLFDTWDQGSERAWATFAWSRVRIRRPSLSSAEGRVRNLVRLCALAALTREFYVHAFGEGITDGWTEALADVLDRPVSRGEAAIVLCPADDLRDRDDVVLGELESAVRADAGSTAHKLDSSLGIRLMPSLMESATGAATFPISATTARTHLRSHDVGHQRAYDWVKNGMPL